MLRSIKVRDHMQLHPVVVHPETDLFEAIHLIIVNRISGVIVVDEHRKPVGMLSELDCLRAILVRSYHQEEIGVHPVRDHMSSLVESVHPDDGIIEIAQSLLDHKHRRRPVVDQDGVLIGQLSCRRILKAVKEFDCPPDPTETLPP